MKWPAQWPTLAHTSRALTVGALPERMPECLPPLVYEPFSLAPLTLTHVGVAVLLIILVSERVQLRRAAILASTYATIMAWYAFRRLTVTVRRQAVLKVAHKERLLLTG